MLKFSNISQHINPVLQGKLHAAQDAFAARKADWDGLKGRIEDVKSALETDRGRLADAEVALKDASRGHGSDLDAMEGAIDAARTARDDLRAKVQQGEERLKDLSQGLEYVAVELDELRRARDLAKMHVVRGIVIAIKPPQHISEKARLLDIDDLALNIEEAFFAWFSHFDLQSRANPFNGNTSPQALFAFIAQYIAAPNDADMANLRARYNQMIWGDYLVPEDGGQIVRYSTAMKPKDRLGSVVNM